MKKSAHGNPVLISNEKSHSISKTENFDEVTIQKIIFDFPECIPVSDIDESYNPLIPVCMELTTPVGPLDILMVTPNGDISIIETKLWRNSEARRKVIAQILDYANELSKWTYDDLQRELNRKFQTKGNILYDLISKTDSNLLLNEADFVDAVNRNLRRGKFLLLIIGDGIREGAASIAEFLISSGHLNFTFGMIELSIYNLNESDKLVIPRTIVKTTEIQKINIELPEGLLITNSIIENSKPKINDENVSPDLVKKRTFFESFWKEFISELEFDDPGQPLPNPTITQNLYIYPGINKKAWISAYFNQSSNKVGVYFRCQNDANGIQIAESLRTYHEEIRKDLGEELIWSWDSNPIEGFGVRFPINDVYTEYNRKIIKDFFSYWVNKMVNALRPRLKDIQ